MPPTAARAQLEVKAKETRSFQRSGGVARAGLAAGYSVFFLFLHYHIYTLPPLTGLPAHLILSSSPRFVSRLSFSLSSLSSSSSYFFSPPLPSYLRLPLARFFGNIRRRGYHETRPRIPLVLPGRASYTPPIAISLQSQSLGLLRQSLNRRDCTCDVLGVPNQHIVQLELPAASYCVGN